MGLWWADSSHDGPGISQGRVLSVPRTCLSAFSLTGMEKCFKCKLDSIQHKYRLPYRIFKKYIHRKNIILICKLRVLLKNCVFEVTLPFWMSSVLDTLKLCLENPLKFKGKKAK